MTSDDGFPGVGDRRLPRPAISPAVSWSSSSPRYLEGGLDADDRARFEAHIAACEHCSAYLEQMRVTLRVVGHIDPDELGPRGRARAARCVSRVEGRWLMSEVHEVDVVVLGAGPAGEVIAGRLGERDLKVAIVEDRLVGGECSYWACMPSKALLRPAQALAEVRRVPGAAEAVTGSLDVAAALERRTDVVHGWDDSAQLPWLEERGILLVRGHGHLAGKLVVHVGETILRARRAVVVAVGTAPMIPPIDGLAEAQPWTNREATQVRDVPGVADRHRRRPGRRRAGPGVRDAGLRRDAAGARVPHPGARRAVRRRAGGGGAAGRWRCGPDRCAGGIGGARRGRARDGRDLHARDAGGRRDPGGLGPAAPDRGPGAGGGRAGRAGQADRGRRRPAGRRARLALRRRRRQRQVPADARGQVPGARRGRPDLRDATRASAAPPARRRG